MTSKVFTVLLGCAALAVGCAPADEGDGGAPSEEAVSEEEALRHRRKPAPTTDAGTGDPSTVVKPPVVVDPPAQQPAGASCTYANEFSSVQSGWSASSGSAPAVGANITESNSGFPSATKTRRLTTSGRHVYSKRSPINSDGTMAVVGQQFYGAATGTNLGYSLGLGPRNEFNWSYTNPQIVFGVSSSNQSEFIKRNIVTGTNTTLRDFPQYDHLTMGDYEGVQSDDDCHVVLIGYLSSGAREHISYNICTNTVDGTLAAEVKDNWSGFSHDGKYIIVEKNVYPDTDRYMTIYDKNFNKINRLFIKPEHGDFAVDCNGNQVYVMDTGNAVRYIVLSTGALVDVPASNGLGWGHVSGRNVKRPGYAYKTVNSSSGGVVVQVKLCGASSTVALAALPHSSADEYNSMPMGAPSGDGCSILFASDYHNQTSNAAYITMLPSTK